MRAFIVAYKLEIAEDGSLVFCHTDIQNVGMQPAGYPAGNWWRGAGGVPHPKYSGERTWRWLAFASREDAEQDAVEAGRFGHRAVVLGEMDVYRRPLGWGSPAVTGPVRRAMMVCDKHMEPPSDKGDEVVVI